MSRLCRYLPLSSIKSTSCSPTFLPFWTHFRDERARDPLSDIPLKSGQNVVRWILPFGLNFILNMWIFNLSRCTKMLVPCMMQTFPTYCTFLTTLWQTSISIQNRIHSWCLYALMARKAVCHKRDSSDKRRLLDNIKLSEIGFIITKMLLVHNHLVA